MDQAQVHALELGRLATFPPLTVTSGNGLTVGASHGESGRANSAWVSGELTLAPSDVIEWACDWLAQHDLPPLFRLSPLAGDGFDDALNRHHSLGNGYNHTDTLHANLATVAAPLGTNSERDNSHVLAGGYVVTITDRKPSDWVTERDAGGAAEVECLMENVEGQVGWASLRRAEDTEQHPLAVGRGVVANQWLSIQAMLTVPEQRRQGLAQIVLDQLHSWGKAQGATTAILDVMATNNSARALYEQLGYEFAYPYCYVGSEAPGSC